MVRERCCKGCCSCCAPKFHVLSAEGEVVLIVKGSYCEQRCVGKANVGFNIFLPNETTKVGQVTKLFSGLLQEMMTNADNFNAKFPIDLDPRLKAVLLGTVFFIVRIIVPKYTGSYSYIYLQIKIKKL